MKHDEPKELTQKAGKTREVRVGKSVKGLGLYARRWYRTDMVIGEIEGQVVSDPEYGSNYCFDLEDGSVLEPAAPYRYLNHSCESNCEFRVFELSENAREAPRRRLMLLALEDIRPGDELTIDYNWPIDGAIPCKCGTESCRGWIVAEGELEAVLAQQAALVKA